jgi:hypothetical protein
MTCVNIFKKKKSRSNRATAPTTRHDIIAGLDPAMTIHQKPT